MFLRSDEGRVVSALVRKGEVDFGFCQRGTYEVIFEGDESDLQYLNGGATWVISGYEMKFHAGHRGTENVVLVPVPAADRRDNWRLAADE